MNDQHIPDWAWAQACNELRPSCNSEQAIWIQRAEQRARELSAQSEPDVSDGHDHEGFSGGCERLGHTPSACRDKPGTVVSGWTALRIATALQDAGIGIGQETQMLAVFIREKAALSEVNG